VKPPFSGEIVKNELIGRGAVDMKGGIACALAATLDHLAANGGKVRADGKGSISFLITGDEEGPSVNGTVKLLDRAVKHGHRFDAALVGEPTSRARLGDTIKIGRRGTQSGTVTVYGKQGHVAYPQLASNPLRPLTRILHRLNALRLDDGNASFEPSNLEVVTVDVGNAAFNVIPAEARANFNVRFNDRWTSASLRERLTREIAEAAGDARHTLTWQPPGESFLTRPGPLVETLVAAIRDKTGLTPEQTTGGGTSDARFFKDVCPVVEFGLVGDTMHQVDERVPLADLSTLAGIYRAFLDRFLSGRTP
jgi:succinyl-diaminopimelate desuccinylase